MVRNSVTDNVLQYLSSPDVLRLKNVSGQWEASKNLQHYALYLNTRVRFYRDIKRDAIRVHSETNIPQLCKFVHRSEKLTILVWAHGPTIELVRGGQSSLQIRLWELEDCSLTLRIMEYGSEAMEVTRVGFAVGVWSSRGGCQGRRAGELIQAPLRAAELDKVGTWRQGTYSTAERLPSLTRISGA
ncbi:hypothetical protein EDB92DRAFT_1898035 [Lactarius akahatsu]|uniref:AP180 N-terminal homology (ANTH) domain-containing protein n=1 Tax=Lactarius akahatsu TaxID=416441 RepID=A0AAD4L5N8_9AGAM|nr:hypothetical protein EDB92DRAFT_1898035 [Lactarius akahatsu]